MDEMNLRTVTKIGFSVLTDPVMFADGPIYFFFAVDEMNHFNSAGLVPDVVNHLALRALEIAMLTF